MIDSYLCAGFTQRRANRSLNRKGPPFLSIPIGIRTNQKILKSTLLILLVCLKTNIYIIPKDSKKEELYNMYLYGIGRQDRRTFVYNRTWTRIGPTESTSAKAGPTFLCLLQAEPPSPKTHLIFISDCGCRCTWKRLQKRKLVRRVVGTIFVLKARLHRFENVTIVGGCAVVINSAVNWPPMYARY